MRGWKINNLGALVINVAKPVPSKDESLLKTESAVLGTVYEGNGPDDILIKKLARSLSIAFLDSPVGSSVCLPIQPILIECLLHCQYSSLLEIQRTDLCCFHCTCIIKVSQTMPLLA
jgi:hypothetical protein